MFCDGYYDRLVRKLPYHCTEPHKMALRAQDPLRRDNSGPITPVP